MARLGFITTDCHDPERMAAFWGTLLNVDVQATLGNPPHYLVLNPTGQGVPALAFQRVPETKAVKNRQHLDLVVPDLEKATSEIVALGGQRGHDVREYGFHWRTMLDVEGNEFCLFPAGP
jgi:hypothetical protein